MKLLIIRLSSLGDCILLCPLAEHLKSRGASEVTVVTKRAYVELFAAARGVDRVVGFDTRAGIGGLLRIAAEHRGRGYLVIDAHNNWRSRVLSWRLGGAAARLRKYYRQRLGLIVLKRPARLPSILGQYAALAATVGLAPATQLSPGGIDVPEQYTAAAAGRMRTDEHPCIAVAPGARWPMKRWPVRSFVELCRRLSGEHGYRLLLLGDDNDRDATTPIASEIGGLCIDISGQTGLLEGAGYLKHCVGFIGNDSGLMHLAEAVGVPVVALFGPTVETFGYFPALARSKTVERELPCRPCSRNGSRPCPMGTQECMAEIDIDTVETVVLEMLSQTGRARYVLTS
jgi:heptosyltransferase-2